MVRAERCSPAGDAATFATDGSIMIGVRHVDRCAWQLWQILPLHTNDSPFAEAA